MVFRSGSQWKWVSGEGKDVTIFGELISSTYVNINLRLEFVEASPAFCLPPNELIYINLRGWQKAGLASTNSDLKLMGT